MYYALVRPERQVRGLGHRSVCTFFLLGASLLLGQGCAARPYRPPPAEPILWQPEEQGLRQNGNHGARDSLVLPTRRARLSATRLGLVAAATDMIGASGASLNGRSFRPDCSGFVEAIFSVAGYDLSPQNPAQNQNGVALIHRYVLELGGLHARHPLPGDLVFFDETHGPRGARLTHVGLVESVEPDGTVIFLHHMQGRVVRGRLNRLNPGLHIDPNTGKVLNDYLRRGSSGRRLAGELFAGYGTVVR